MAPLILKTGTRAGGLASLKLSRIFYELVGMFGHHASRYGLQGNGHERDKLHFKDDDFYIFDMYNCQLWPADRLAKTAINCDKPIRSGTDDKEYLARLEEGLATSFREFSPDIVLYNAGTDILEGDPLGA